ncbi:tobamovirus multiplication protein 1-like [Vicia villosa]|uniref:tobamovirus multiplication protein 1-like n=1 Tax=Vicia villosa TaxID=3911 RepID=UPI00273C814E|nr:tobamovirus multiplication protein 1-like [Vicia villosa]
MEGETWCLLQLLFALLVALPLKSRKSMPMFVSLTQQLEFVAIEVPGLLLLFGNARSLPTDKLKMIYISINVVLHIIQIFIWIYLWIDNNSVVEFFGKTFVASASFVAALGFLLYEGRTCLRKKRSILEPAGALALAGAEA